MAKKKPLVFNRIKGENVLDALKKAGKIPLNSKFFKIGRKK